MTETWKPVVGYEGRYEVSDLGRVRSLDRITHQVHFHTGRVMAVPRKGRVLKAQWTDGYASVNLYDNDAMMHPSQVHRLVIAAFTGPRPEGLIIRHLDGVKANNTPGNLAYGTHKENCEDSVAHGAQVRGERVPHAKLTRENVEAIRAHRGVITQAQLAEIFGVGQSTISAVQLKRSWTHV